MRRFVIAAVASGALACADLIGIRDIPTDGGVATDGSTNDGASPGCDTVLTVNDQPDGIAAAGGFIFSINSNGVRRCNLGAPCSAPPAIIAPPASQTFVNGTVGPSSIAYTLTDPTGGGSIRSAALDGSNDNLLLGTQASPEEIATLGTYTIWVDADSGDVHCIGCISTGDAVMMAGLGSVNAAFGAAASIYALKGGSSGDTLYACGVNASCGTSAQVVVDSLDSSTTANQISSSGAYVFVARNSRLDVARIDSNTNVTSVLQGVVVTALTADPASGDLFYATDTGEIGRVKSDGTRTPLAVTCGSPIVFALAFDATHVYAAIDAGATSWRIVALSR